MSIDSRKIWFAIKNEKDVESADCYILSSDLVPGLSILEDKLPQIREEYKRVVTNKHLFTPYFEKKLSNPPGNWDTIPLLTFDLKRRYCNNFPELSSLLEKIPGLVGCYFSKLSAGASIEKHSGITNAVFRCQAALELPSQSSEVIGFCVANTTTRLYYEKFISFVDANVHSAWNKADSDRVILIVDIMRPQFRRLRYFMSARIILSYVILRISEKVRYELLVHFISLPCSRHILNFLAIPLVPIFYLFVKTRKLLLRHS